MDGGATGREIKKQLAHDRCITFLAHSQRPTAPGVLTFLILLLRVLNECLLLYVTRASLDILAKVNVTVEGSDG